jgi:ferric-dicitrate binding protein FerR (iron transport regulator)
MAVSAEQHACAHANFGHNLPIRVCSRRIPDENRERATMHAAATRSIIAAAGLAAIGVALWPQDGMPQAQQGVPTVHRDVALVDDSSTILPRDQL